MVQGPLFDSKRSGGRRAELNRTPLASKQGKEWIMAEVDKLRVGLLVDSPRLSAWARRVVEQLVQSDYADVCLVVVDPRQSGRDVPRGWRHMLLRLVYRLEKVLFRPRPDAFDQSDCSLLANVGVLEAGSVAEIRAHDLDVLVQLSGQAPQGDILDAARYGVWSYRFGDQAVNQGGPASFWEVFQGHYATGVTLVQQTPEAASGRALSRSYIGTDPVSVRRNQNRCCWVAAALLPRKLKELHAIGGEAFMNRVARQNLAPALYGEPHRTPPTNGKLLGLLLHHMWRVLGQRVWHSLFRYQWVLFFAMQDGLATSLWQFKRIVPPRDRFWADPFVVERDGRHYVFMEELINDSHHGTIVVAEVDEEGNWTPPRPALEEDHHLSYPFMLEWEGEIYMIPESQECRAIKAYKPERFPDRWVPVKTLMSDIDAVDATLFEHDGRWWLFANVIDHEGSRASDELFLFYADEPLSDAWTPHPANPIVSDTRCARPAGKLLRRGDKIYRPSQDCTGGYGRRIQMNEVLRLTTRKWPHRRSNLIGSPASTVCIPFLMRGS